MSVRINYERKALYMKDYNMTGTEFTNKMALSLQPGRENRVGLSDTWRASDRFLHLAKVATDKGFLGLQISADGYGEFSGVAFTSAGVSATAEDYNWIFKKCAVSKPDRASFLRNLFEENRRVYVLSYKSKPAKNYEVSEDETFGYYDEEDNPSASGYFKELIEMLAEAGAVIQMIADSSEETKDCGLIFISFPEKISLRLRGMVSMAMPHAEIEYTGDLQDAEKGSKHIPDELFRSIMSNLLYALINRPAKKEPAEFHRQGESAAAAEEASGGISFDGNGGLTPLIDDLELSVRSYICLRRAGIKTIEELKAMTDEDLLHVRNLGRKNVAEIKETLAAYLQEHPDYDKSPSRQAASYYDMLDELIGLKEVKQQIRKIAAFAKMKRAMSERGGKKMSVALNMEFIGNPGTAKTTVARISAGIFHEIGLLPGRDMIEVGRADLIGKYEGQTAAKVKEVFLDAKGKMLFIDEAYSLTECWEGAYGDEAINTIVQEMENNREDTIVVFAGYPDKMKAFFDRNPGLRSRVPFSVRFDNYSTDEMVKIAELEAKKKGFRIAAEAVEKVTAICGMAVDNNEAGNGRFCRNLVEGAVLEYALRNYDGTEEPEDKDFILEAEDFAVPDNLKESADLFTIGFTGSGRGGL